MPGFVRRFSVAKPPIGPYPKRAIFRPVTPLLVPARRLKAGTAAREPPAGPGWIHEIRMTFLARKDARGVRLFTGNGYDFRNVVAAPVAEHVERDR